MAQRQCSRGGGREQDTGDVGGEGGEDGMLEDMAIGGSWGAGLGSGEEGVLVFLGAVTNQLAWCGKVTLLTVGLSSDRLWMCAVVGMVVRGIEYA